MAITPPDTPSSPDNFAQVTPHGQGPAPYDIQAPLSVGEITAAFDASLAVGGSGVLYPQGQRQAHGSTGPFAAPPLPPLLQVPHCSTPPLPSVLPYCTAQSFR